MFSSFHTLCNGLTKANPAQLPVTASSNGSFLLLKTPCNYFADRLSTSAEAERAALGGVISQPEIL